MDAEFGRPQRQFGMSTYAFESADRLTSCFVPDGVWTPARIDRRSKRFDVIPTAFTDIAQLRAAPGRVVFFCGSPSEAPMFIDLDLNKRNSPRLASLAPPSPGRPSLRFGRRGRGPMHPESREHKARPRRGTLFLRYLDRALRAPLLTPHIVASESAFPESRRGCGVMPIPGMRGGVRPLALGASHMGASERSV
jgi:hypothetical protein